MLRSSINGLLRPEKPKIVVEAESMVEFEPSPLTGEPGERCKFPAGPCKAWLPKGFWAAYRDAKDDLCMNTYGKNMVDYATTHKYIVMIVMLW